MQKQKKQWHSLHKEYSRNQERTRMLYQGCSRNYLDTKAALDKCEQDKKELQLRIEQLNGAKHLVLRPRHSQAQMSMSLPTEDDQDDDGIEPSPTMGRGASIGSASASASTSSMGPGSFLPRIDTSSSAIPRPSTPTPFQPERRMRNEPLAVARILSPGAAAPPSFSSLSLTKNRLPLFRDPVR